jgi:transcriptional regulator with XRE-family HTH domain
VRSSGDALDCTKGETRVECTLGDVVRQLREARGLLQDTLAQQLDISQGNVSRIEKNRAKSYSLSLLQRLADALGVRLYELFALAQGVHLDRDQALTQTEAALLEGFRNLPPDYQKTVLAVIETLGPPRPTRR